MASEKEIDELSGIETTGHEWDGIKELKTPLPRWWLWTLYASIVWAIGYWLVMPAWPLVTGYTNGLLGYSDRAVVAQDIAKVRADQGIYLTRIQDAPLERIRTEPDLLEFALAGGRSAFAVNCSQCHGLGAAGSPGYPNLNDDDWLWGGGLTEIHQSIRYGIRSGHDETRQNEMPAFLTDEMLSGAEINDVAEYVLSLSGGGKDAAAAGRGAEIFAEQCVACHAEGGVGNRELGGPNLADAIWLYGGDKTDIVQSVAYSRRGAMPAWEGRLDAATLKLLAVFVHSLGGGE